MRQKQPLLFGLPASCLACLCVWLCVRAPRIDRETFTAIELGMSKSQVERLIGGPAGNHMRRRGMAYGGMIAGESNIGVSFRLHVWQGDDFAISVGFDEADRAQAKFLEAVVPCSAEEDQG